VELPGLCGLAGRINAVADSFCARPKKELIHGRTWPSKAQLRTEVLDYIEVFFNRRQRHSTLGMLSPVHYENRTLGGRSRCAPDRLRSRYGAAQQFEPI
jgi:transposase InsO family protein